MVYRRRRRTLDRLPASSHGVMYAAGLHASAHQLTAGLMDGSTELPAQILHPIDYLVSLIAHRVYHAYMQAMHQVCLILIRSYYILHDLF